MELDTEQLLLDKIHSMKLEHRDLDDAISALSAITPVDQMQLQRLKKRKLHLRDLIQKLESQLIPDMDA